MNMFDRHQPEFGTPAQINTKTGLNILKCVQGIGCLMQKRLKCHRSIEYFFPQAVMRSWRVFADRSDFLGLSRDSPGDRPAVI